VPCWPELWDGFKRALPTFELVGSVIAYVALVTLLLWAPRVRKRWQLVTARVLGAVSVVPLAAVLPALLFGALLASGSPPTKSRMVRSPDGQEAKLTYYGGFLGRDYTEVTVQRTGCCRHLAVFSHAGPSWFDDPNVEWLDDQHLRISYHARPADPQHCESQIGDVRIVCLSHPWPEGPSTSQTAPNEPTKP